MIEQYINIIDSSLLKIFIISLLPITELRFSIPYGIFSTETNWFAVSIISIIGNIFIGINILYVIAPVMKILQKNNFLKKIINFIFMRTKNKSEIIDRLKFYGLIIFIAIPLPFTGVWTGALASYLLGFSKTKSVLAIICGVIISGTIVTVICLSGQELLYLLNISLNI